MSESRLARTLSGPEPLEEVGGKAHNLAILADAGIPIPRSVVVTRRAWQLFIDAAAAKGTYVASVPANDSVGARSLAISLRGLLGSATMPTQVEEQLRRVQRDTLGAVPVAVRSSAVIEDSQAFSFAGQFESFLNLSTVQAVADAVRKCWLYAVSERVVEYQVALKVGAIPAPMAVLVQEMVIPKAAGVLFSQNPVTGDSSTAWLSSNWGLATTVVDGTVRTDNFTLSQQDGSIIEMAVGDKREREDVRGEGVTRGTVDPTLRTVPSLAQGEVLEIWRMGKRAEHALGAPVDMEWAALPNGGIIVLQARPITTEGV